MGYKPINSSCATRSLLTYLKQKAKLLLVQNINNFVPHTSVALSSFHILNHYSKYLQIHNFQNFVLHFSFFKVIGFLF